MCEAGGEGGGGAGRAELENGRGLRAVDFYLFWWRWVGGDDGGEGGGTMIVDLVLQFVLSRGLRFSSNFPSVIR